MAGSIDDVYLMVLPVAGGGCRGYGDSSILLLLHPVHGGFTVVDFADAVVFSCIEKNSFCCSCFSCINMGHDAYISYFTVFHEGVCFIYHKGVYMDCCCTSHKKTRRSEEEKKNLIVRLNRIEGQVRGIRRMLEEDSYCLDILVQSSAVSSAFASFERELLSSHISGCFKRGIEEGDQEVVPELIRILEKLVK